MTADAAHCTIDCIAHQVCAVCGRRKAPRGRSVPLEMANGLCTDVCEGYQQAPKPGHLWPDEEDEVFRTVQAVR
jgi:hypothetical protein